MKESEGIGEKESAGDRDGEDETRRRMDTDDKREALEMEESHGRRKEKTHQEGELTRYAGWSFGAKVPPQPDCQGSCGPS